MQGEVTPLRDLVLVEKLDMGRERSSPGGIILPATLGSHVKTKADYWRGRVLARGPKAHDVEVGEDVLVYTWNDDTGGAGGLYTGVGLGQHRVLIKAEDIVCAVHPDAHVECA